MSPEGDPLIHVTSTGRSKSEPSPSRYITTSPPIWSHLRGILYKVQRANIPEKGGFVKSDWSVPDNTSVLDQG